MNYLKIIFYILILFSFSCTYEPEGDNFVKIDRFSTPDFDIIITGLDEYNDFEERLIFDYEIDFKDQRGKLYQVNILIDNIPIYEYTQEKRTVYINKDDHILLKEDYSRLSIVVTTNSGTNSIADLLDLERYEFAKEYFIRVVPFTNAPDINNVEFENGSLRIDWDKYTGLNFQSYEIHRVDRSWDDHGYRIAAIEDIDSLSCFDNSYLIANAYYKVHVRSKDGSYKVSDAFYYEGDEINLRAENIPDKGLKLEWNPTKFTSNFERYEVWFESQKIKETNEINDTTFLTSVGKLGSSNRYILKYFYKKQDSIKKYFYTQETHIYTEFGTRSFRYNNAYTPKGKMIYYDFQDFLQAYDTEKNEIVHTFNLEVELYSEMNVSPRGEWIILEKNFRTLAAVKPLSPSNLIELDDDLLPIKRGTGNPIAISDNGRSVIQTSYSYYLVVFDFASNQFLHQFTPESEYSKMKMSSNGEYLALHNSYGNSYGLIYKVNPNNSNKIWQSPSYCTLIEFDPDDENKAYCFANNYLIVLDLRNNSEISRINISALQAYDIDFDNQQILLAKKNDLFVADLNTGEVLFSYNTGSSSAYYSDYLLTNNQIYWVNGYRMRVIK